jgi:hypothetical protein
MVISAVSGGVKSISGGANVGHGCINALKKII